MKFWQLTSVLAWVRSPHLLKEVSKFREEWFRFGEWEDNMAELCDTQDREKLDYELPMEFVEAVLKKSDSVLYLGGDGWLRSYKSGQFETINVLEAFRRYGGTAIEEAWERSCFKVE